MNKPKKKKRPPNITKRMTSIARQLREVRSYRKHKGIHVPTKREVELQFERYCRVAPKNIGDEKRAAAALAKKRFTVVAERRAMRATAKS